MPTIGTFSSGFGYRVDPVRRGTTFHAGQDIAAPTGTPIIAATAGTVAIVETPDQSGGYGNYTCIDRGAGFATCYAHQSAVFVHVGSGRGAEPAHRAGRQHRRLHRTSPALRGTHQRRPRRPGALPALARPAIAGHHRSVHDNRTLADLTDPALRLQPAQQNRHGHRSTVPRARSAPPDRRTTSTRSWRQSASLRGGLWWQIVLICRPRTGHRCRCRSSSGSAPGGLQLVELCAHMPGGRKISRSCRSTVDAAIAKPQRAGTT